MKKDRIKRGLHSLIDGMDYRLQRKVYFYILGLLSAPQGEREGAKE